MKKKIIISSVFLFLLVGSIVYFSNQSTPNPTFSSATLNEAMLENRYATYLVNKKASGVKDDQLSKEVILPSAFILPIGDSLMNDPFAQKGPVYRFIENKTITFPVNVEVEGLYQIGVEYYPIPMSFTPMEIDVKINGESPYFEATQIKLDQAWKQTNEEIIVDRYGNDIALSQEQFLRWNEVSLRDSTRLFEDPLLFHLHQGENQITITKIDGAFFLGAITIQEKEELPNYNEYLTLYQNDAELLEPIAYEAENYFTKNDSTIQLGTSRDPGILPYSVDLLKLNIVGLDSYYESGQEMRWQVQVPTSGYYSLSFKVLQNNKFTTSYRTLKVNNEIPFEEAKHLPFSYHPEWQNVPIHGRDNTIYQVYLEANTPTEISLSVDGSLTRVISEQLLRITNEINQLGLDIKAVTGTNVDPNIDWNMKDFFETIDTDILSWIEQIEAIITYTKSIYGYEEDCMEISDYRVAISKLTTLYEDVDLIPKRLTLLSEGSSSAAQLLAAHISDVNQQELTIDRFYVHLDNMELPRPSASFWDKAFSSTQRFFLSFFDNRYSPQGSEEEVVVWVNRSRQYVELLQKITDETFTKETGIPVRLSIMQDEGKLLLANSANQQPDVALSVSSWIPNEYGMRGAILDLKTMEGFSDVLTYYQNEQLVPLLYNDQLFGLPETENFFVLYYRSDTLEKLKLDVPNTWDDVIEMLPILQRYGMNFYHPLSNTSALKSFASIAPFIYQYGGEIYQENGMAAIDHENTVTAMQFITDLYIEYSLPLQVSSFFNEFRYNKIPIGISDMGMYLELLNAAPEISGLWNIAVVPGIERDGVVHREMGGAQQANMIFKKSDKQEEAWSFLKWWMSTETQVLYSETLTNTYGRKYLWNSANMDAFAEVNWKKEHKEVIIDQWSHLKEVAKIPGSYIIERELSNTFNSVVFQDANLRSTMSDALIKMNKEINRKMVEFSYIDKQGKILKQFILPSSETIQGWREEKA